jgi:TPR repeat protein
VKRALLIVGIVLSIAASRGEEGNWRELWDRKSLQAWYAKSEAQLRSESAAGNANAMWVLSNKLHDRKSYDQAAEWRAKAIEAGCVPAITESAGQLRYTDIPSAFKTLERMSATGYPWAKVKLADILIAGAMDKSFHYIKPDASRAIDLLQQAADERSGDAFLRLAQLYACGVGEPRNDGERPAALFLKAANAGFEDAMLEMAQRSRIGFGVEKDFLAAAGWATRARFQRLRVMIAGHVPEPDEWIGAGHGDEEKALRRLSLLFADALEKHSPEALTKLAALHAFGELGKKNLPRAAALYAIAQKAGSNSAASHLNSIQSGLNEEEKTAMQRDLAWMNNFVPIGN